MAQCRFPVTHGMNRADTAMRRKLLLSRGLDPNLCGNQGYQSGYCAIHERIIDREHL